MLVFSFKLAFSYIFQDEFKRLVEDIQQFYKSRKPETVGTVGTPIIGLFPEDNVLYRAQILEIVGTQYKVYYIDFGNVSTITKIWPIDKKFMNLPAQAIVCSLRDVAPSGEAGTWPDADSYSNYFDKESFLCRFIDEDENKYVFSIILLLKFLITIICKILLSSFQDLRQSFPQLRRHRRNIGQRRCSCFHQIFYTPSRNIFVTRATI